MTATEFKELVMPMCGKLHHFAYMLLRDNGEAEDAVQEVCLKLWKIRDSLEKYNSIEAFAMKVTKNWCLDRLKAKKPVYIENYYALADGSREVTDPHKIMENVDRLSLLNNLLNKLPEQQRIIMQLRELECLEFDEIAEIMDMNSNAIRVCLSRARNKIREEMINYESDGYQSNKTPAGKIR